MVPSKKLSSLLRKSPIVRKIFLRLFNRTYNDYTAPNLIILGSQKSGTTSLHNYLNKHPDIFMSHFKEPGYFLDKNNTIVENTSRNKIRLNLTDEELLCILRIGYKGEKYFGESSTYYSMSPIIGSEVPENIKKASPNANILSRTS